MSVENFSEYLSVSDVCILLSNEVRMIVVTHFPASAGPGEVSGDTFIYLTNIDCTRQRSSNPIS